MHKILLAKKAAKFLAKLDLKACRLVSGAIQKLSNITLEKNLDIKALKGKYSNMFRLRVGSRRVLFTIDKNKKEIKIWLIGERGGVYE